VHTEEYSLSLSKPLLPLQSTGLRDYKDICGSLILLLFILLWLLEV
jgi:hypothetical protein